MAGATNDRLKSWATSGPLSWPNIDVTPDAVNWTTANTTLPSSFVNAVAQLTGFNFPISIFFDFQAGSTTVTVYRKVSSTSFGTGDYQSNPGTWTAWTGGSFNAISVTQNQYVGIAVNEPGSGTGTLRIWNFTDNTRLIDTLPYTVLSM